MSEKDIKNFLEPIKNVKPNDNWVVSCRSKLAFRMEMERKKHILDKDLFVLNNLFSSLKNDSLFSGVKWVYAVSAGFLVLTIGSGATALVAKNSLPGSSLYAVKIAIEKVRLETSLSQENKLKIQAQITENRIKELEQVIQTDDDPNEKKEKLEQVVTQINQQLAQADSELGKSGSAESQKTVAMAKSVSDNATKAEKALSQAKEILPTEVKQSLGTKLSETAEAADKASTKALGIMVGIQGQSDGSNEVAAKLTEKIQNAEEKIKIIEQKIGNINASSTSDKLPAIADNQVIGNDISDKTSDKLPIIRAVLVKDQSQKAQELIEQAKTSLQNNDMTGALETMSLAKTIILGAEKIADESVITVKNNQSDESAANGKNNASSTPLEAN